MLSEPTPTEHFPVTCIMTWLRDSFSSADHASFDRAAANEFDHTRYDAAVRKIDLVYLPMGFSEHLALPYFDYQKVGREAIQNVRFETIKEKVRAVRMMLLQPCRRERVVLSATGAYGFVAGGGSTLRQSQRVRKF
jgi:hypothetical protein